MYVRSIWFTLRESTRCTIIFYNEHHTTKVSLTHKVYTQLTTITSMQVRNNSCITGRDKTGHNYRQWLKWFCEAEGGGAHPTKPGWSKPHTHSNPTNLTLLRHKITRNRFSQEGLILLRGGSNGSRGAELPLAPSL